MSIDAHANFAFSLVATAPSPAASGTTLVVATGQGVLFPAVPFNATVWPIGVQPTSTNAEIVRVTNIAGDTFTITRTQESTPARTILVGDQISATITVKTLTDVETGFLPITGGTLTGDLKFTDATFDIGKTGATRPRDLFISRNLTVGGVTSDLLFTDATFDIGKTGATRPRDGFFSRALTAGTVVAAGDGAVGAPSLSFTNEPDCGLYKEGTNAIAAATNGVKAIGIDSTQFIDSPTQPRCSAYHNTTQNISDATVTALNLNTEDFDVSTMHDTVTNNTRITIPTGGDGLYLIIGQVAFANNATGVRFCTVRKNGSTTLATVQIGNAGAASGPIIQVQTLAVLVATDYVELMGFQNSTAAMNVGSASRDQGNILQVVKLW